MARNKKLRPYGSPKFALFGETLLAGLVVALCSLPVVTAVPAMGVIAEAMVAIVMADALLEKFGGDSLGELRRNMDSYLARVSERAHWGEATAG